MLWNINFWRYFSEYNFWQLFSVINHLLLPASLSVIFTFSNPKLAAFELIKTVIILKLLFPFCAAQLRSEKIYPFCIQLRNQVKKSLAHAVLSRSHGIHCWDQGCQIWMILMPRSLSSIIISSTSFWMWTFVEPLFKKALSFCESVIQFTLWAPPFCSSFLVCSVLSTDFFSLSVLTPWCSKFRTSRPHLLSKEAPFLHCSCHALKGCCCPYVLRSTWHKAWCWGRFNIFKC